MQLNRISAPTVSSESSSAANAMASKVYYNPAEAAAKKNARREQALLKVGTPLPNKGIPTIY